MSTTRFTSRPRGSSHVVIDTERVGPHPSQDGGILSTREEKFEECEAMASMLNAVAELEHHSPATLRTLEELVRGHRERLAAIEPSAYGSDPDDDRARKALGR